jgi:hypothetical protein
MPIEAYECTLSGVLAGQFVQTVINVALDNTTPDPPYAAATAIASKMCAANGFVEKFTSTLPVDYQATSLRVRRVSAGGGPTAIFLQGSMIQSAGQRTGSISSAQVSPLVIIIPTTNPNRTGRIFLPGVSEDDIDQMALVAGLITDINSLISHMEAGDTSASGVFVYGVLRRALALVDPISAAYISPLIGTQRRRLRPV